MIQEAYRCHGALHAAAIGDGFALPLFRSEDGNQSLRFLQRSRADEVVGFDEVVLSPDDVLIPTNNQRQLFVGDRSLFAFVSRSQGLLVGNRVFMRSALGQLVIEYGARPGTAKAVRAFIDATDGDGEVSRASKAVAPSRRDQDGERDLWERALRLKIGHELAKSASGIFDIARRLDRFRMPPSESRNDHRDLVQFAGDLTRQAHSIRRYTDILTREHDIDEYDMDPRLYMIRTLRREWKADPNARPARLRDVFNASFHARLSRFSQLGIKIPRLDPSLNLELKMDEIALSEVFSEIVDNILQHGRPHAPIVVREVSNHHNRGLQISNMGLRLSEKEAMNVFHDGFRGQRAIEHSQGMGAGLFFAQRAMHAWGAGLRHTQRALHEGSSSNDVGAWAWHDFTLVFPNRLIVT